MRTKLTDETLHICFQGDYFDNGDLVEDTLLELAKLKKDYEDRIHIILGNRDLNKFRIYYELKLKHGDISDKEVFKSFGQITWPGAYKIWEKLSDEKKLHNLLKETMGAELHDPDVLVDQKENQKKIIQLLLKAFTPDNFNRDVTEIKDAKDAVAYIFKNGKIADFDEETGVLMSHAGGYSQAIFEKPLETPNLVKTNYFEKIAEAIKHLHSGETPPEVSDDVSGIVDSHNKVYVEFLKYFKADEPAPKEHFYLVAMGLKPIEKPSWRFKSFIETCSHKNDFTVKPPISAFNEKQSLPERIKVVAYGHLNTFENYPFIYKRNGLTLLSNDVSVARSPLCESIYLIGYGDDKVTTYKYVEKEEEFVNNDGKPDTKIVGEIIKIKELDEIKEYDDASKSNIEWETHNNYFKSNISESAIQLEKAANNAREVAETMKNKNMDGAKELDESANNAIKAAADNTTGGKKQCKNCKKYYTCKHNCSKIKSKKSKKTRKKSKRKTIKKNKKNRKTIKKKRKTRKN